MTNPTPNMLDYAPVAPRRWPWRRILIGVLFVAVAGAGKLCWDKFSPVVQDHLRTRRLQAAIHDLPAMKQVHWTTTAVQGQPLGHLASSPPIHSVRFDGLNSTDFKRFTDRWRSHRFGLPAVALPPGAYAMLWAGQMTTTDGQACVVFMDPAHVDCLGGFAAAIIVYVETEATLLGPSHTLQPPQLLRLDIAFPITFSNVRLEADASRLTFDVVSANGSGTVSFTLEADGTMRCEAQIQPTP